MDCARRNHSHATEGSPTAIGGCSKDWDVSLEARSVAREGMSTLTESSENDSAFTDEKLTSLVNVSRDEVIEAYVSRPVNRIITTKQSTA